MCPTHTDLLWGGKQLWQLCILRQAEEDGSSTLTEKRVAGPRLPRPRLSASRALDVRRPFCVATGAG